MKTRNEKKEFSSEYSLRNALGKGSPLVWPSIPVWGLGSIARRQIVKGLIFLAAEFLIIPFL